MGVKERNVVMAIFILAMAPHVYRLSFPQDRFLHDDAYYYLKTARNIAAGFGPTFDRENVTNGFHPLWMGVCVLASYLTSDADLYVQIALALNVLFALLLSVQLFRMFRVELGLFFIGFLVCLINWSLYTALSLISGLETALYVLLVMLVVELMHTMSWSSPRQLVQLGVLLGLTFLARTSFGLFLPVLIAYMIWNRSILSVRGAVRIGLLMVVPAALLTFPYLAWNYSLSGHFQQISGLVLNQFHSALSPAGVILHAVKTVPKAVMLRPLWVNAVMVVWATLFLLVLARSRPIPGFFRDDRLYVLVVYSAILLVYYMSHFAEGTRTWHYMVPWVTLQIVFVHFVKASYDLFATSRAARTAIVGLIILMSLNYLVQEPLFISNGMKLHPYYLSEKDYAREMTNWVKSHLPADARIGVFNAGYIGYHSGRKVINLDGLINGMELYTYLSDGRGVWKYALDKKLGYLADVFFGRPPLLDSEIGPRLKLVHRLGPTQIRRGGKPTYVDAYVWKIVKDSP